MSRGVSDLACNETLSVDDGDRTAANASIAVTRRFQVAQPTNQNNFRVAYPNHQAQQQQLLQQQQQRTYTASLARPVASRSYTVANSAPPPRSIMSNTVHPLPGPSPSNPIPVHRGFQPPNPTAKVVRPYSQAGTVDHEHGAVTFTTHSTQPPHIQPTPQLGRNTVLNRGDERLIAHGLLSNFQQQQPAVVQNPFVVNSLRLTQAPVVPPSTGSKTAQGMLASVQQMRSDSARVAFPTNPLYRTNASPPQPQNRIAGASPIIPHPRYSAQNNGTKLMQTQQSMVRFQTTVSPAALHHAPPPSSPAIHRVQATQHVIQPSGSGMVPHQSPTPNAMVVPGLSTPSPRPSILRKSTTPGSAAKRKLPFMTEPTQNGSPSTPSPSVRNIIQTMTDGSNSVAKVLNSVSAGVSTNGTEESPRKRQRKQQFDTSTHEPIMMAVGVEPIKKPIWDLPRDHPLAQEYYKNMILPEKKKRGRPRSDSRPATALPDQFYVQTGVRRVFVPLEGLDRSTPRTGPGLQISESKTPPRTNITSNRSSTNSAPPANIPGPSASSANSITGTQTTPNKKAIRKSKESAEKTPKLEKGSPEKKSVRRSGQSKSAVPAASSSKQADAVDLKKKTAAPVKRKERTTTSEGKGLKALKLTTPEEKQGFSVARFLAQSLKKAQNEKRIEDKYQKVLRRRGARECFANNERQVDEQMPSTSPCKTRVWNPIAGPFARSNHFKTVEQLDKAGKQALISFKVENFALKARQRSMRRIYRTSKILVKGTDEAVKKYFAEHHIPLPSTSYGKRRVEKQLAQLLFKRTSNFKSACVPCRRKRSKHGKVKKKMIASKTGSMKKSKRRQIVKKNVEIPICNSAESNIEDHLFKDEIAPNVNGEIEEVALPNQELTTEEQQVNITVNGECDETVKIEQAKVIEKVLVPKGKIKSKVDNRWIIEQCVDELVEFVSETLEPDQENAKALIERTLLRSHSRKPLFRNGTWSFVADTRARRARARQERISFGGVLGSLKKNGISDEALDNQNVCVPDVETKKEKWWNMVASISQKSSATIGSKVTPFVDDDSNKEIDENTEPVVDRLDNAVLKDERIRSLRKNKKKRKVRHTTDALMANQMYENYCKKVDEQRKTQERVLLIFEKFLKCGDPEAYNKLQLDIIRDREVGDSEEMMHRKRLQRIRMTLMMPPVDLVEQKRPDFGENCNSIVITPSEEYTNSVLKNQSHYWRGPPLPANVDAVKLNRRGYSQAIRSENGTRLVSGEKELYLEDVVEYDNDVKLHEYNAMMEESYAQTAAQPPCLYPTKFERIAVPVPEVSRRTAFFKPKKEITFLKIAPKSTSVFSPADPENSVTHGDPIKIAQFASMREMLATTFKAVHTTTLMMEQTRDAIMCGLSPTAMKLRTIEEPEEPPPPPPPERKVVRAGKKAMKHKAAAQAKAARKEAAAAAAAATKPRTQTPKHPRAPRTPVLTESTFERQIRRAIQESLKYVPGTSKS